jgi:hypothetical protein
VSAYGQISQWWENAGRTRHFRVFVRVPTRCQHSRQDRLSIQARGAAESRRWPLGSVRSGQISQFPRGIQASENKTMLRIG